MTHDEQPPPVHNDGESMHDAVIGILQDRKQVGLDRYGTILQAFNTRDAFKDYIDELADAMVYGLQVRRELEYLRRENEDLKRQLAEREDEISIRGLRLG